MPGKSGLSHTIAAVLAVVISPVIKEFVTIFVTTEDLVWALRRAGAVFARNPSNPFGSDTTTSILYLLVLGSLTFLWGYAYHIERHK